MASVSVRYIVDDVDAAIAFYTERLGFEEVMNPAPTFAMLARGGLRLLLSRPSGAGGGGQAMPDGTPPEPGGWNRFSLEVDDLEAAVERLRADGVRFRNEIVTGVGGKQILLEDPSGNPIELFEPTSPQASLAARGPAFGGRIGADLLAFVRASLPPPPLRLLEIGAGDGALARALTEAGYEALAIDPEPAGTDVRPVALNELDEPAASFAAAVAVTSLHHVEPLDASLGRLAELLPPGGLLVVDEFDVGAFDERAAAWWLQRRRALGGTERASAEDLVGEHRAHLHPLERIVAALEPHFRVGLPVRGPYLYRWELDEALRPQEEDAIARAEIPATGARLVAQRRP